MRRRCELRSLSSDDPPNFEPSPREEFPPAAGEPSTNGRERRTRHRRDARADDGRRPPPPRPLRRRLDASALRAVDEALSLIFDSDSRRLHATRSTCRSCAPAATGGNEATRSRDGSRLGLRTRDVGLWYVRRRSCCAILSAQLARGAPHQPAASVLALILCSYQSLSVTCQMKPMDFFVWQGQEE